MREILLYKALKTGRYLKDSDYLVIGKTIVDDEDFEIFNKYRWFISEDGYVRHIFNTKTKILVSYLHRKIMNCPKGKMVDHINHDKLDNRKENLRIVSNSENQMNQKVRKSSSKYKGVYWNNHCKNWISQLKCKNKLFYLGIFNSEVEAAKVYNEKDKELFGKYAKLNEVQDYGK
jgi:hypothetical protein